MEYKFLPYFIIEAFRWTFQSFWWGTKCKILSWLKEVFHLHNGTDTGVQTFAIGTIWQTVFTEEKTLDLFLEAIGKIQKGWIWLTVCLFWNILSHGKQNISLAFGSQPYMMHRIWPKLGNEANLVSKSEQINFGVPMIPKFLRENKTLAMN